MKNYLPTSRRRFLIASGSAIGAVCLSELKFNWLFPRQALTYLYEMDAESVEIAKEFLAEYPDENNPAHLESVLLDGHVAGASLEAHIKDLVAKDYRDSNLIALAGWTLARSEGRLMSYLYLSNSPPIARAVNIGLVGVSMFMVSIVVGKWLGLWEDRQWDEPG